MRRLMPLGKAGIVVVDRFGSARLVPIPAALVCVFRRAVELVHGDAGPIAAEPRVIFQGVPGQRVMVVADPE